MSNINNINSTIVTTNLSANTISASTIVIKNVSTGTTVVALGLDEYGLVTSAYTTSYLYGFFAQTGTSETITNTTVESSLITGGTGTLTVPTNTFKVGESFHAKLMGKLSCNSSATLRIRVKSDSVVLADTGVVSLDTSTNRVWEINIYFTIRNIGSASTASIVSAGLFTYIKNSGLNLDGANFSSINDTTFDTTIDNTLVITAEWGAASASDSISSDLFVLHKIY